MSNVISIADGQLAAFQVGHAERSQLLVFSAPWCAPCRTMAPAVEDVAALYAETIAVARICIDDAPELAQQFGVRAVPTLIVMAGGEELHRNVGPLSKTRLAKMLDDALAGRVV